MTKQKRKESILIDASRIDPHGQIYPPLDDDELYESAEFPRPVLGLTYDWGAHEAEHIVELFSELIKNVCVEAGTGQVVWDHVLDAAVALQAYVQAAALANNDDNNLRLAGELVNEVFGQTSMHHKILEQRVRQSL
jgi:hypothetical protein